MSAGSPRPTDLLRKARELLEEAKRYEQCQVCIEEIDTVSKALDQLTRLIELAERYGEERLRARELEEVRRRYVVDPLEEMIEDVRRFVESRIAEAEKRAGEQPVSGGYSELDRLIERLLKPFDVLDRLLG